MTTKKDNFLQRTQKLGTGLEETIGIPEDGFQDPTGEFPKRDYNFGSGLNKAARGTKINKLYTGGGDIGVSLNIEDQRPSEFPFNQVDETTSGHVVEYDDTPGGERILIRHRTGAGVEMRADGSVLVSSTNNKIEVTGGDQTVIVEGAGNLVYKGNLNLVVTGDYNVDVGGNYNVNVAGSHIMGIRDNHRTFVSNNSEYVTKGTKSTKTIGKHSDIMLSDNNQFVKGTQKNWVQGEVEFNSEKGILMTGKESIAVTSKATNVTGSEKLSVLGTAGDIGGKSINFTGKVYQGNAGPKPYASDAAFFGSFFGQSTSAMFSRFAWKAEKSKFAELSDVANAAFKANTAATGAAASVSETDIPTGGAPETINQQQDLAGAPWSGTFEEWPVPEIVTALANNGEFAIRDVVIDEGDKLKDILDLTDDYNGIFNKHPSTQEIRSAMRSSGNRSSLLGKLMSEERVGDKSFTSTPPAIGRTVGKEPTSRFGYTPIGNAIENRGKRFTPK